MMQSKQRSKSSNNHLLQLFQGSEQPLSAADGEFLEVIDDSNEADNYEAEETKVAAAS